MCVINEHASLVQSFQKDFIVHTSKVLSLLLRDR